MGLVEWAQGWKDSAEAKFEEKAVAFARERAMNFFKSHLQIEHLPKLKRALLIAADQEFAEASWSRLEAVITKYSDSNFTLLGRSNITPELEEKIRNTVIDISGFSEKNLTIAYDIAEPAEDFFTIPGYVWQNSFITEPLRRFIDNPEIIEKIFDSLTPRDIKASDPMFYLSRLAPVFVLYFCLCLLGHKDQVHKLDPLFDLLAMGVVPHHIEMIEDKTGEVCLCGESRICVAVERDLEK